MTESQLHTTVLYSWFALSATVMLVLLFISAPYGRHSRGGWGPTLPSLVGWILMEAPAALVILAFYLTAPRPVGLTAWVFLLVWEVHYVHRAFIYPFRLKLTGKTMPLTVALMGVFFNGVNGYLNGRYFTALGPEVAASWLLDPRFICGLLLFGLGLWMNLYADQVLINLRGPGETGYKIPRGGPYRLVSCPNYLGEMIEWCGWALLTWSLPGLAFAAWTAANLLPRALTHHRWYKEKFPGYPRERKAVIPFLL